VIRPFVDLDSDSPIGGSEVSLVANLRRKILSRIIAAGMLGRRSTWRSISPSSGASGWKIIPAKDAPVDLGGPLPKEDEFLISVAEALEKAREAVTSQLSSSSTAPLSLKESSELVVELQELFEFLRSNAGRWGGSVLARERHTLLVLFPWGEEAKDRWDYEVIPLLREVVGRGLRVTASVLPPESFRTELKPIPLSEEWEHRLRLSRKEGSTYRDYSDEVKGALRIHVYCGAYVRAGVWLAFHSLDYDATPTFPAGPHACAKCREGVGKWRREAFRRLEGLVVEEVPPPLQSPPPTAAQVGLSSVQASPETGGLGISGSYMGHLYSPPPVSELPAPSAPPMGGSRVSPPPPKEVKREKKVESSVRPSPWREELSEDFEGRWFEAREDVHEDDYYPPEEEYEEYPSSSALPLDYSSRSSRAQSKARRKARDRTERGGVARAAVFEVHPDESLARSLGRLPLQWEVKAFSANPSGFLRDRRKLTPQTWERWAAEQGGPAFAYSHRLATFLGAHSGKRVTQGSPVGNALTKLLGAYSALGAEEKSQVDPPPRFGEVVRKATASLNVRAPTPDRERRRRGGSVPPSSARGGGGPPNRGRGNRGRAQRGRGGPLRGPPPTGSGSSEISNQELLSLVGGLQDQLDRLKYG